MISSNSYLKPEPFKKIAQDGLLVRSNRARQRRVIRADGQTERLHDHLAAQPVQGRKKMNLVRCEGPRKRSARQGPKPLH